MNKQLQIYYTAVLGALGGLFGWWLIGSLPTSQWNIWLAYPLVGAGLGMLIAGCIAATEGALVKQRMVRAVSDAVKGGFGGALFGLLGLLLAEVLFLWIGGGFAGRMIGWMLMGAAIGFGDLLVSRQPRRALQGALGGLIGGALGGALYEGLTWLLLGLGAQVQVFGGGAGLMLLGACIGALIPLARQVLAHGELRVLSGTQAGLVREVSTVATIGRDDGCDLYLPDRAIAWHHVRVRRADQGFALDVLPQAERGVHLGAQEILPGNSVALRDGEQFRIGETLVEFVGR